MLTDKDLDSLFNTYATLTDDDRRTYVLFLEALADWFSIGDLNVFSDDITQHDDAKFFDALPPEWKKKMLEKKKETDERSMKAAIKDDCDIGIIRNTVERVVTNNFSEAYLNEATKVAILNKIQEELLRLSSKDLKISTSVSDALYVDINSKWQAGEIEVLYVQTYKIWFEDVQIKVDAFSKK